MGGRTAQLTGPDVHLGREGGQTAGGIDGQHAGRVVGAGQEHGVHHIDAAHRLAGLQADGVAPVGPDGLKFRCEAGRDGDTGTEVGAAFQHEKGRHHLGQAGDAAGKVGVLLHENFAGVGIEEVDGFLRVGGLNGHRVDGETGQCRCSHECSGQNQSQKPPRKGMKLHKLILLRKPGGFLAPTIRAIIKNTINEAKEKGGFSTMTLSFGGKMPRDEGAVFVAANATVLGDVTLGRGVNIWYGAVLRADEGALILGENSNVQDNAVLHCDPGGQVVLGKNVTVGHSAIVHGCTVGDNSLIGMHATILNHAVVGRNCIIGAGALVPEGMVIPDNSVAVGVPARVIKTIRDDQLAHNIENAKAYVEMGRQHAAL